jgi:hypothetical protein
MRWRGRDSLRRERWIDDLDDLNFRTTRPIGYRLGLALQQHRRQSSGNLN